MKNKIICTLFISFLLAGCEQSNSNQVDVPINLNKYFCKLPSLEYPEFTDVLCINGIIHANYNGYIFTLEKYSNHKRGKNVACYCKNNQAFLEEY